MVTVQTDPQSSDAAERIDRLRLRLSDAAADLRAVPTATDFSERLQEVKAELEQIELDLALVLHLRLAEEQGLLSTLEELDDRLAAGWEPDAHPVAEVIDRLGRMAGS